MQLLSVDNLSKHCPVGELGRLMSNLFLHYIMFVLDYMSVGSVGTNDFNVFTGICLVECDSS